MPRPKGARDALYEDKRLALLGRMTVRVMRREIARPSLRQLAEAAGVSVPTLRHYFGDRSGVMAAILQEYLRQGRDRMTFFEEPSGPFAQSVRDYARALLQGMRAPREVRLGDVFAVAIAEGLLDASIGPSALGFILDPSIDLLQRRLARHIERGEMIEADTRAAALVLLSPLLLTILHQDHMGGAACNPVDMDTAIDQICDAFIRAYAKAGPA